MDTAHNTAATQLPSVCFPPPGKPHPVESVKRPAVVTHTKYAVCVDLEREIVVHWYVEEELDC
jgi:hypothetical protein